MVEIIGAIIEAILSALSALAAMIEAIASLFTAGGEALGAGEALVVLFLFVLELLLWLVLITCELIWALIKWRKPKMVRKPVIWRPAKLGSKEAVVEKEDGSK